MTEPEEVRTARADWPDKLRMLADWFDVQDAQKGSRNNEVQQELREMADFLADDLALEPAPSEEVRTARDTCYVVGYYYTNENGNEDENLTIDRIYESKADAQARARTLNDQAFSTYEIEEHDFQPASSEEVREPEEARVAGAYVLADGAGNVLDSYEAGEELFLVHYGPDGTPDDKQDGQPFVIYPADATTNHQPAPSQPSRTEPTRDDLLAAVNAYLLAQNNGGWRESDDAGEARRHLCELVYPLNVAHAALEPASTPEPEDS